MSTTKRKCLSPAILEGISAILGDTNDGLTGSQIHNFLLQAKIVDIEPDITKRYRLYNAFVNFQNKEKCSNNILAFIALIVNPIRFVNNNQAFEKLRSLINQQLSFVGYNITEAGRYIEVTTATLISDVEIKVENLKQELEKRNSHSQIFEYCTTELLVNNYFHSVFEANKGLFKRIRELSLINKDGIRLIEEVFSTEPILIINSFITESEKNEHVGFCNIIKGLCGIFRNTTAHEPKIDWDINEQDALDILGLISYCHRRLDNAQKIR